MWIDIYATPHFVQKDKSGGGTLVDMAVYHMELVYYGKENKDSLKNKLYKKNWKKEIHKKNRMHLILVGIIVVILTGL